MSFSSSVQAPNSRPLKSLETASSVTFSFVISIILHPLNPERLRLPDHLGLVELIDLVDQVIGEDIARVPDLLRQFRIVGAPGGDRNDRLPLIEAGCPPSL